MIEEISYGGWKRNLRLRGATTELVVTLDVGPRVIRYGFHQGKNVFAEFPEQMGGANEKEWMIRGGHRLWTAPEADHSYELDNGPVTWKKLGDSAVEIIQPSGPFGFQKTIRLELLPGELVRVTHRLTNVGKVALDVSPWALSVMAPGGLAVVPQPELDVHPSEFSGYRAKRAEDFLPNRRLILWAYTNLSDGRYNFSRHFLRMSYRAGLPATKLGFEYALGWIAYQNNGTIFAKHIPFRSGADYPDRGSNLELFTNPKIFELESLASTEKFAPNATREHVEHWVLRQGMDLTGDPAALEFFRSLPSI